MPRGDREPASTYDDALRWLFTYSSVEEWAFDPAATLPLEARLVADMFWVSDAHLLRDLRKIWRSALGADRPSAPVRRAHKAGWR